MNYSHIVWTTYDTWLPDEKRGEWGELRELYESTGNSTFTKPLHESYSATQKSTQVLLTKSEQKVIRDSIYELAENDRIAGELLLHAVGVNSSQVHILICGKFDINKRKIARLKSRAATLLKFSDQYDVVKLGAHTWSKGIWAAEFNEKDDIFKIKSFINQQNA